MIRVLIAEDQAAIRAAFSALISAQPDMTVVYAARNGLEAISHPADVAVLDIRMPIMDGIEAARKLQCPALMLTTFREESLILAALEAGAQGFLLKDSSPEMLLDAIRRIARGESYLDPTITATVLKHVHSSQTSVSTPGMTERESEILTLICQGLSNRRIADHLKIAETTVKTHIKNLLRKTDTSDRVNLVIWAARHDLI
ncbi:response regulator [Corynebacterium poyangense]|uniref:Response regulator n=1 Tax=Corynebacterium poyangense TaxID=2684405 RepID=A0A7H0SM36_9CORY|nr:response regulator transcription factor [Corynebacterium poyangense]QNQ89611.1 response regulator [Corynebacterium poyangense]